MSKAEGSSTTIRRWYRSVADALLAAVLILGAVNVGLCAFPSLRKTPGENMPIEVYGVEKILRAYPGWKAEDLIQLHDESMVSERYEPVVEFKMRPIAGRFVNATNEGYRRGPRDLPWPPNPANTNVFVFGGSTTFGWLLADAETIPARLDVMASQLACAKPIAVYNFGQPSYISRQEVLFFQSLAMSGQVPDAAVFIDGFNDFFFHGENAFTWTLGSLMNGTDVRLRLGALTGMPLYELARNVRSWLSADAPPPDLQAEAVRHRTVRDKWRRNKTFASAVGRQYGVKTAFVLQPVLPYKYDLQYHFLAAEMEPGSTPFARIGRAYTTMEEIRGALESEQDFLWLADMQAQSRENIYVDRIHYNAVMSDRIAGEILQFLKQRDMIGCGTAGGS